MSEKEFIEKWGVRATKTQSAIERVVLKKILNDFAKVVNHLDHQNKELKDTVSTVWNVLKLSSNLIIPDELTYEVELILKIEK